MKVLFTDTHKYIGYFDDKYAFKDQYGDILLLKKAKYIDRERDIVIMFLDNIKGKPSIEFSYATKRKLGDKLMEEWNRILSTLLTKAI